MLHSPGSPLLPLFAFLLLLLACSPRNAQVSDAPLDAPHQTQGPTSATHTHDPMLRGAHGATAAELVVMEADEKYGYSRGDNGPVALPAIYDFAFAFDATSGLAGVLKDGKWSYINAAGEPVYGVFLFDNGPDYPVNGLVRFRDLETGLIGVLDERGQVLIPPQFDMIMTFDEAEPSTRACTGCVSQEGEHEYDIRWTGGKWSLLYKDGTIQHIDQQQ